MAIDKIQISGTSGFGKIGQVVSVSKKDTFTTTSTSLTALTGVTASITPTATSSKIFVSVHLGALDASTDVIIICQLLRGTTVIGEGDSSGGRWQSFFTQHTPAINRASSQSNQFLDAPSSTSELTYSIKIKANSGTIYVNRSADDHDGGAGNAQSRARTISTITLTEVLA